MFLLHTIAKVGVLYLPDAYLYCIIVNNCMIITSKYINAGNHLAKYGIIHINRPRFPQASI